MLASDVFVILSLSLSYACMVDDLSLSIFTLIHSLNDNFIGAEGAVAISEAMKTMTKLNHLV